MSKAISEVFAALVALVVALPASAQGFDFNNQQPGQQTQQQAQPQGGSRQAQPQPAAPGNGLPNIGRAYDLRVTTGAHSNSGWEKSLTNGDPNLRHWTWMPVTNYDQGYLHMPAGGDRAGHGYKRPDHVYIKPNTIPLPLNPAYNRPIKPVAVESPPPPPKPAARTATRHSSDNVSGKLVFHQPKHTPPAVAKTYAGGYGDVSAHMMPPSGEQSTSVSGRLLSHHTHY